MFGFLVCVSIHIYFWEQGSVSTTYIFGRVWKVRFFLSPSAQGGCLLSFGMGESVRGVLDKKVGKSVEAQ